MAVEVRTINAPAWVDLASPDPKGSQEFYSKLFGWHIEVNPDPQYGGYALAKIGGKDAAGIGGKQMPEQPTVWSLYIGTADAEALGRKIEAAGGTVVAPAFDIGDQGKMAVFQDPTGAFISGWQPSIMGGFQVGGPNAFGWAELNTRDLATAVPFYEKVFGWGHRSSDAGGPGEYVEFQKDGESVLGALPMPEMVPAAVPSYWLVYFNVQDVDAATSKAIAAGATQLVEPQDFPGGRFSIVTDPQGASFGLLRVREG